jgi:hypothetical protein
MKYFGKELKRHAGADYILYAKNHYERFSNDGDLWSDLFKIQSAYCGADAEFITKEDVLTTLIHLVQDLVSNLRLIEFIADISPNNAWRIWKNKVDKYGQLEWDFESAVASKCLSMFLGLPVIDSERQEILRLLPPNPDVLPLNKIE